MPESTQQLSPHLAVHPQKSDSIAALLGEIITVSNQLRKTSFWLHRDEEGFPPGGILVLQILAKSGAMTVPQIARARLTSRQNIQMTVNRLKSGGWIANESNPAHRRSDLVRLTPKGQKLLVEKNRFEEQLRAATSSAVDLDEASRTEEILARVRQALAAVERLPTAKTPSAPEEPKPFKVEAETTRRSEYEQSDNDLPVNLL